MVAIFALYPHWNRVRRQGQKAEYHAMTSNFIRMNALHMCIVEAAISDPKLFARVIGNGLVTNAVGFPEEIRTNFLFTTNQITLLYWDRWGRPLNVSVTPAIGSNSNCTNFEVLVWSSGPNGLNENRAGDDIFSSSRHLELSRD
jgi:hypothetical protein